MQCTVLNIRLQWLQVIQATQYVSGLIATGYTEGFQANVFLY